jgi:purine-binding chemotaxis protein CheW
VLVCEVGGEQHGLIVDRVRSVVRLTDDRIEPPPQMGSGAEGGFLAGIGRDGEGLIILLDLKAVVTFSVHGGR